MGSPDTGTNLEGRGVPETFLRLLGLFLMPTLSLKSIRPHLVLWQQDEDRELEDEVVKWLCWLLVHGLVEANEALHGVDDVSTDEDAVR